ncbi:MAG: ABC transporter permease [Lachnospiraceae bacterium]|nr:ABC transporter permease [Lachnospiraceae bacterium]
MEILTLLKANIKRKKGAFVGILLLTAIIVAMMSSIFSVRENYEAGMHRAFSESGSGDIVAYIKQERLTEEVRTMVESNALVESVDYYEAFLTQGIGTEKRFDSEGHFVMEMREGIRLFNEDLNGFVSEIPPLQAGEIYLPLGLRSKIDCEVGDEVSMALLTGEYAEFTVKGFVQEPSQGSLTIGYKQIFISHEDYVRIWESHHIPELEELTVFINVLLIHQAKDSALSAAKFQRQLNLETRIIDLSTGSLNKDQSIRYSTLMPDIVIDIVQAFSLLLFVVILIVISHSIGTEIEIDYVTLGILKAQGFTERKLRTLFSLQYLLAQIIGILLGGLAAIPIGKKIGDGCMMITGVLPENGLSIGKALLFIIGILLVSIVLIFIKTGRVVQISPVRAISGGKEEIFFDSRLNLPIQKKLLSASLSLRQITSAAKSYWGTVCIAAILAFSMITVTLTGNLLSSHNALRTMGIVVPDIEVYYTERDSVVSWEKIDEIVESYSKIEEKNFRGSSYASVNGENLYLQVFAYPEYIPGILKGRAPLYDNEIVITEMVADMLEIGMGDEVTVAKGDREARYIISGIFQSANDSGTTFAMGAGGAEKIADVTWYSRYYVLADAEAADAIAEEITKQYGDGLGVHIYKDADDMGMEEFEEVLFLLKTVIYSFSVLFAFVVVAMVCNKAFIRERRDIGIYKAMGFTAKKLRMGFALRFLWIGLLGSVLGAFLSILLSQRLLGIILRLIGLSKIILEYTWGSVAMPAGAICLSFALFAYLASHKIKQVAASELILE